MTRNRGFVYEGRVRAEDDGLTLLAYLTKRFRHSPAEVWIERIDRGRVWVDGAPGSPEATVRNGQTVAWHRPPWSEPDAPLDFTTLLDDDHLVAVAKPAGLPVLPAAGYMSNTLLARVREIAPHASPLHRLGRWTSGIVLFGKSREARRALGASWRSGEVIKRYRALARGHPARHDFAVEVPIGPVPHVRLGSIYAASPDGKPARSRVRVVAIGPESFLADVFIETGRPHQIRIHLAAAGYPLAGDPVYSSGGRPAVDCVALPGDPGYRLHAAELRFRHPISGCALVVLCDPPDDLRAGAFA